MAKIIGGYLSWTPALPNILRQLAKGTSSEWFEKAFRHLIPEFTHTCDVIIKWSRDFPVLRAIESSALKVGIFNACRRGSLNAIAPCAMAMANLA